jgi:hypothetical protein
MVEMFKIFRKYGIEQPRIDVEEWDKYYSNFYNVLALDGLVDKTALIFAVEDCIQMYLARKAGYEEDTP